MENIFWREVFCSVSLFMQGALFCYPEKLLVSPFWDNPIISQNNKAIRKSSFPQIANKIKILSDFYIPGTCQLYSRLELENRYGINISEEDFVELSYIIKTAFRKLGLRDNHGICNHLPYQPLLISIINLTKSGCNVYNRLVTKKSNLRQTMTKQETKWHTELGCVFGLEFWNKTYCLVAGIKNENKLKWLQFQINRNSLFTNYRVNKFKPYISSLCSFCSQTEGGPQNPELISHLFFECDVILNIWQQVKDWLASFNICMELNRNKLLFGVHSEPGNSILNFTILTVKYYIWRTKFQNVTPNLSDYKNYLKNKLDDLKNACEYEEKESKFEKWIVIYDCLVRSCTGTNHNEAPTPTVLDNLAPAQATDLPTHTDHQTTDPTEQAVVPTVQQLASPIQHHHHLVTRVPAGQQPSQQSQHHPL